MKTLKTLLRSGLFIAAFLTFAGIAHATDYTVTTLNDTEGDGTCDVTECTLREAIDAASTDGTGPNQVLFDATLSGGTMITTTGGDNAVSIEGNTAEVILFANNDITISAGEGYSGNPGIFLITNTLADVTLDGINFRNGVVVIAGSDAATVTIQNCEFTKSDKILTSRENTLNVGGHVIVQDNTFDNTNNAIDAADGVTIQRNEFTNSYGDIVISVTGESDVLNNTIYVNNEYSDGAWGAISLTSGEGTINVTGNEIFSKDTNSGTKPTKGIFVRDLTNTATFNISGNTILPDSASTNEMDTCFYSEGGSNITFENNICSFYTHAMYFAGNNATTSNVLINHNTFLKSHDEDAPSDGITFNDMEEGVLTTSNITITNNIISGSKAELEEGIADRTGTATITNDYNLIFNAADNTGITLGEHFVESYPGFIQPEEEDLTEFELAPFSAAIGAGSDGDLGAVDYTGEGRRTTIYVDDDGARDYTSVDFNEIDLAVASAIDGDTVLVAAGTYDVSTIYKAITLTGENKATTIIDATGHQSGLLFLNADNSTVSGFTIQNAEGERTVEFSLHSFDYNGHTYNTIFEGGEGSPIEGYYLAGHRSTPANPEIDLDTITEGETSKTVENTPNAHLALGSSSGEYLLLYFLDDSFPDQATAAEWLSELEGTATIDYWSDDAFVYSDTSDTYTFDSTILEENTGVTLTSGSPDATATITSEGYGIALLDSSNNSISDINITDNNVGIYFTGDSLTNTVLNIIFSNNAICDIYSNATGNNSVNGSTVGGTGCYTGEEEEPGDTTAPTGLTALTSSARTTSSVTLNWTQVTEANFGHYEIWYGTDTNAVTNRTASEWDADNDATLSTISTTTTTITGLESATQYYFKIWAVDASSNEETVDSLSVTTKSEGGGGGGGNVITDDDEPEVEEIIIDGPPTNPSFTETVQEIITDAEDNILEDASEELESLADLIEAAEELTETETVEDIAQTFDLPLTAITEDIMDIAREVLSNDEDTDGDGVSNLIETLTGRDPYRAEDSDNDGIPDFADPNPVNPESFETPLLIANPDEFVFSTESGEPLTINTGRLGMAIVSEQGLVFTGIAKPNEEITITTRASNDGTITIKTKADKNGRYIVAGELAGLDLTANSILAIQAENSEGYKKSMLAKVNAETTVQPKVTFTGGDVKAVSELDSRTVQGVIAGTIEMPKLWTDVLTERVKEYIATTEYNEYFVKVVAAAKEKALGEKRMIVQGHAEPGSIVIIAFKSVTYSSVIIADKNGYFETEVPQELIDELATKKNVTDDLHQFIAFTVDYKSNEVSPFVQGLFKIYK